MSNKQRSRLESQIYFSPKRFRGGEHMTIRQCLQKAVGLALKKVWQKPCGKLRAKAEPCLFQNNDLTNPLHSFNVEQREMDDYNDRRAQEALYDYLQDSQRFQ